MSHPIIKDVAQASGTSIGTVSNVLNHPERVSTRTQEKVFLAIEKLGYIRNDAARQLRAGHSSTLGLALPTSTNPFFAEVTRGAETAADEMDLRLIFGSTGESGEREERYLDLFEQIRVRGVLFSSLFFDVERLRSIRQRGTPVVLVDHDDPAGILPAVTVDDDAGGYLAANHLMARGCQQLLFVGATTGGQQVALRFQGASRAAAEKPGARLVRTDVDEMTVSAGRQIGQRILDGTVGRGIEGIFAGNDLIALGMMQTFVMTLNQPLPDGVRLVGYDDIDFAQASILPLTSVRQPAFELGHASVNLLRQYLDRNSRPVTKLKFQLELVVRQTT